ncbi:hypothetical protein L5515_011733 [Caenorhabditis briggsae]|nr:hypothetical protein L5515_011733 [Caenorhabditis briggsae]
MFLKISILAALISEFLAVDPYSCADTQTINPPANISNSISYPSNWQTSNDAPQYAANQNCTFTVNIPKGMFVFLQMKATTDPSSVLIMTDSAGYQNIIKLTSLEPYFLMDPSFTVSLQSVKSGTFAMSMTWHNVNPTFPTTYKVHPNSTPLYLTGGDFDNSTVIESETKVNLLALLPTLIITDVTPYLRNTQVYDGPSTNSKHVGNLYQIVANGNRFVSSGKYLTLWSLVPGFSNIGNSVIIQDYFDVKDFETYKPINCISDPCKVEIDASTGTAAAIRYNPAYFFVKDISMPETNKLSVYTDFVTPAHKLADYTSSISKSNTPQKFFGRFNTFVLNQDQAFITLSFDPEKAGWATAVDSRRGFFMSPNYALNSSDQNINDTVSGFSSTSNISYAVDRSAISGAATLNVLITSKQKVVVNNTFSTTNFPGGTEWTVGDTISVIYNSNGVSTTGAFVSFGFDHYNSGTTNGVLVSMALAFWMMFSF